MKLNIILLGILLILASSYATTYLESHNKTLIAGGTYADTAGMNITMNMNANITMITKDYLCTATTAYVMLNNGTQIANATFSGNHATFNVQLNASQSYRIQVNSLGSTYSVRQTLAGNTPISGFVMNWTNGIYAGVAYTSVYNIVNLTFTTTSSPIIIQNVTITNQTGGSSINITQVDADIYSTNGTMSSANITFIDPDGIAIAYVSMSNTSAADWNWTGIMSLNTTGIWTLNVTAVDNNTAINSTLTKFYRIATLQVISPTPTNNTFHLIYPMILNFTSDVQLPIASYFYINYWTRDYHFTDHSLISRDMNITPRCTRASDNLSCYYIIPYNETFTAFNYSVSGMVNNISIISPAWKWNYSGCGNLWHMDYVIPGNYELNASGDCFNLDDPITASAPTRLGCNRSNITGNGSGKGVIFTSGQLVWNCDIRNFTYGIHAQFGQAGSNRAYLFNNTVSGNVYGIYVHSAYQPCDNYPSNPMGCIYNIVAGNNTYGFYFDGVTSAQLEYERTHMFNITARNNSVAGIYIKNSSYRIANYTAYNNTKDLVVSGNGAFTYNIIIINMTLLNPEGTFENYTYFRYFNDSVTGNEEYFVTWSKNTSSLPSGYQSFAQKYASMGTTVGTPIINWLRWNWSDSELTGYTESNFEIWKYATNWTIQNATLNISNNTLSIDNLSISTSGIYGILESLTISNTAPSINVTAINSSANNSIITDLTPDIEFNATDAENTTLSCTVWVNGITEGGTNASVSNNTLTNITLNYSLSWGTSYNFTVNCTDGTDSNISLAWTETTASVPNTPAVSIEADRTPAIAPTNLTCRANISENSNLDMNVSIFWFEDGVIVDAFNATYTGVANGTTVNDTVLYSEGLNYWSNYTCSANATNIAGTSGQGNSSELYINYTIGNLTYNSPANNSVSFLANITINFTLNDSNTNTYTCSFYDNGTLNATGSYTNGTSTIVLNITDGAHNVSFNCSDSVMMFNISNYTFFINTNHTITQLTPPNGNFTNSATILFNSSLGGTYFNNCTYNINGSLYNDTYPNCNVSLALTEGLYWWNVTYYDSFGDSNISTTWNVTVDRTPPNVSITPTGYAALDNEEIHMIITWNDTAAPYTVVLNISGVRFTPASCVGATSTCSYNHTYIFGTYPYDVQVTDAAGNTGSTSTYTLTITGMSDGLPASGGGGGGGTHTPSTNSTTEVAETEIDPATEADIAAQNEEFLASFFGGAGPSVSVAIAGGAEIIEKIRLSGMCLPLLLIAIVTLAAYYMWKKKKGNNREEKRDRWD